MAELLAEDGERTVDHARSCGVDVTFEPYPGHVHGLPFMSRVSQPARELLGSGIRFLRTHLTAAP